MEFSKKVLKQSKRTIVISIIGSICRIIFKIWLTTCIAMLFTELGIRYNVWTKTVTWFISLYVSNKLFDWLSDKIYIMIWPDDFDDWLYYNKTYSDFRSIFDKAKQLIFYTDEKKSS